MGQYVDALMDERRVRESATAGNDGVKQSEKKITTQEAESRLNELLTSIAIGIEREESHPGRDAGKKIQEYQNLKSRALNVLSALESHTINPFVALISLSAIKVAEDYDSDTSDTGNNDTSHDNTSKYKPTAEKVDENVKADPIMLLFNQRMEELARLEANHQRLAVNETRSVDYAQDDLKAALALAAIAASGKDYTLELSHIREGMLSQSSDMNVGTRLALIETHAKAIGASLAEGSSDTAVTVANATEEIVHAHLHAHMDNVEKHFKDSESVLAAIGGANALEEHRKHAIAWGEASMDTFQKLEEDISRAHIKALHRVGAPIDLATIEQDLNLDIIFHKWRANGERSAHTLQGHGAVFVAAREKMEKETTKLASALKGNHPIDVTSIARIAGTGEKQVVADIAEFQHANGIETYSPALLKGKLLHLCKELSEPHSRNGHGHGFAGLN